jgi:hypothetical protein
MKNGLLISHDALRRYIAALKKQHPEFFALPVSTVKTAYMSAPDPKEIQWNPTAKKSITS